MSVETLSDESVLRFYENIPRRPRRIGPWVAGTTSSVTPRDSVPMSSASRSIADGSGPMVSTGS